MPYYRIVIWTDKRVPPFEGIRYIAEPHIDTVFHQIKQKAEVHYNKSLVNVEVQMLPNTCDAVLKYIKQKEGWNLRSV